MRQHAPLPRSAFVVAAVMVAAGATTFLGLLRPPVVARADAPDGIAAFETVRAVLQHPRCQNCHIPGDAPLQFDEGRVHAQSVRRGPDGKGMPGFHCATCHGEANLSDSYGLHVPPGGPDWKLPPREMRMVFIGKTSAELAAQLKDTSQTGGKDLKAMLEHIEHAPLVLWGWKPGLGRAPVPIPHETFVAKFREWMAAGAPIPSK